MRLLSPLENSASFLALRISMPRRQTDPFFRERYANPIL
jgi:hypothetical protein